MIHLTQAEFDRLRGKAAEADRLADVLLTKQQHLDGAITALVECRKVHHADCLLGVQIRAAIDMAASGHRPNRPLAEWMAQDAAILGEHFQKEPS